jgi:hypothetical protein
VPARVRGVLDRAGDRRVERVGDVLDDQAERAGAAMAQAAGEIVAGEAQPGDGRPHALGRVGPHAGLAVDHAGHRLEAHACGARDVAHRRPRHSRRLSPQPSLTTLSAPAQSRP